MISESAPAKVNLTLRCGAVRDDGYHPLDSVVVFADWGDALSAEPAERLALHITGSADIPAGADNLVNRAARALQTAVGTDRGAALTLDKRLPAGAGLGGGSADAAASLRLLNRLWALDLSISDLARIGAGFGADVPACVWSRPLRMRGIGERIDLLRRWPDLPAVIVFPGVSLSTADVFAAFDASSPPLAETAAPPDTNDPQTALAWLAAQRNDLQTAAEALAPVIRTCLTMLARQPGVRLVRMSGSGSACFGVFDKLEAAQIAEKTIRAARRDWMAQAVTLQGARS
ncbi:MAG: 4-(cytidine 5'-diphospho)-2-C-methyl-D-erythritol kinase [Maricaulaceae bacterium]|nr:4-(cytidine 5'-diphospho)-2-C-methyl-D-erythritol kinase [Maricaulaceae bacterium]